MRRRVVHSEREPSSMSHAFQGRCPRRALPSVGSTTGERMDAYINFAGSRFLVLACRFISPGRSPSGQRLVKPLGQRQRLPLEKTPVNAPLAADECLVAARFDDLAVIHHQQPVQGAHGR